MGLNDQAEKLRQAWEWLENAPFDSEQYQAAYEYLDDEYVVKNLDLGYAARLWDVDSRRWREWYEALGGDYQEGSEDNQS
jgi:hypothetical protein